jgi:hypothetical protein
MFGEENGMSQGQDQGGRSEPNTFGDARREREHRE